MKSSIKPVGNTNRLKWPYQMYGRLEQQLCGYNEGRPRNEWTSWPEKEKDDNARLEDINVGGRTYTLNLVIEIYGINFSLKLVIYNR